MISLKDIKTLVFGKKDTTTQEAAEEQDEKIGNVPLNAGEHGTIFGFNRNIIVGTGLAILGITIIATIFAMDNDTSDAPQKAMQRPQQASTAQDGKHETAKLVATYDEIDDLKKANAQFAGQNGQQGRGTGTGTPSPNRQQEQQATTPAAPPTSLPAVPQTPVSVPAPVQISEEDKEQQAYMQRMQSAIAFAISASASQTQTQVQDENAMGASQGIQDGSPAAIGGILSTASQSAAGGAASVSYAAPGKYTLQAGTVIPVVLCTGINSDIGGQVVAQVQQDMYDTATGHNLLIPAGSKILGTYVKGSPNNSGRVEITFTSIVLPDGGTYAVGNSLIAMDGAGYAGVSGKVNRHTGSTLSAGMFSSALAALGSVAAGNTSNNSNTYSAGQLAMQGAMANMMNTASQLFQQGANRQMTVTAKPGTMFSVYVAQGLTLQRGGAR